MELKIDKKVTRGFLIAVLSVIVAYMLLRETERVKAIWDFLKGIFSPFVIGAIIAFILNVPVRFFENKLGKLKGEKARRIIAIFLTLLAVTVVIAAVLILLVPQLENAIRNLIAQLPNFFHNAADFVNEFLNDNPKLKEMLGMEAGFTGAELTGLLDKALIALESSLTNIVSSAFTLVSGMASGIINAIFSIIFAFYCMARKETLARQGRKLLYSLVKEKRADDIVRVLRMTNSTFSNFITGQCLEAVILGLLFVIPMIIFRMPYIPLICVLIAVTALIPVVGAFAGCFVGAFLILVNDPMQAHVFIVMFLLIQQFEGNVIYPRVVGESVGLPGIWVLLAVAVGGGLMGPIGMLLMVPFASVIYTLLREFTAKRVAERNIPAEKLECQPPKLQPHFMFSFGKRRKEKKATKNATDEGDKPNR